MNNNFYGRLTAVATSFFLVLGFSGNTLASSHRDVIPSIKPATTHLILNGGQLKQTLANSQKKQQFLFISKKLDEFRLPKDLALIPVIESQYNKGAVSPKGAGGLWQLMPATAKQYGISSNDRFQLAPSTVAALHYFNVLYKKFHNWEFAIAAYNAGDGRVQRALSKNPSAKSVQQLSLPQETKQYVQKFYKMQNELRSVSA